MFINEFNKEESIGFINLVNQLSNVDNKFAKEEEEIVDDYIRELKVSKDLVNSMDYKEAVSQFDNSSKRIKAIAYFELMGLALSDGEYEDHEVDFLDKLAEDLKITRAQRIGFANFFCNFKDVYNFAVVEANEKIDMLKEQIEALIK